MKCPPSQCWQAQWVVVATREARFPSRMLTISAGASNSSLAKSQSPAALAKLSNFTQPARAAPAAGTGRCPMARASITSSGTTLSAFATNTKAPAPSVETPTSQAELYPPDATQPHEEVLTTSHSWGFFFLLLRNFNKLDAKKFDFISAFGIIQTCIHSTQSVLGGQLEILIERALCCKSPCIFILKPRSMSGVLLGNKTHQFL